MRIDCAAAAAAGDAMVVGGASKDACEIQLWLRRAGLGRFYPRFCDREMTIERFLDLTPADFEGLGVRSPADRKRLMDVLEERRRAYEEKFPGAALRWAREREEAHERRQAARGSRRKSGGAALITKEDDDSVGGAAKPPAGPRAQRAQRRRSIGEQGRSSKVTVCVRKRPLSAKERSMEDKDVITTREPKLLFVHELKTKVDLTKYLETHTFQFDAVFSEEANNFEVYEHSAKPLVDVLFEGGRATCFAYGQTGAGKTYTMQGALREDQPVPGIYALAIQDIFERMDNYVAELGGAKNEKLRLYISFYEIYGGNLRDLLDESATLACREDANNEVQIVGLSVRACENPSDVLEAIEEASLSRSTGITGANDDSSRSHAVFQVELRRVPDEEEERSVSELAKERFLDDGKDEQDREYERTVEVGRLCFIDLAGSERGSDTAANDRATRMEGAEINKSLLALKECIRAMDKRKEHTPFRGSKLTQVLKASFTGKNSRTVMIANVSPSSSNVEHTLNTLRYADRVKEMRGDRVKVPRKTIEALSTKKNSRAKAITTRDRSKSMIIPAKSFVNPAADAALLQKLNSNHKAACTGVNQAAQKSKSRPNVRLRAPLPPGPRTRSQTRRASQLEVSAGPALQPKRKPRKSCIARFPRTRGTYTKSPQLDREELESAKLRAAKLKAMALTAAENRVQIKFKTANEKPARVSTVLRIERVDHLQNPEIDNQQEDDLLFSGSRDDPPSGLQSPSVPNRRSRKLRRRSMEVPSTVVDKENSASEDLSLTLSAPADDSTQGLQAGSGNSTPRALSLSNKPQSGGRESDSLGSTVYSLRSKTSLSESPVKPQGEIRSECCSPRASISSESSLRRRSSVRRISIGEQGETSSKEKALLQTVMARHRVELDEMMKLVKGNVILLEQIENGSLSTGSYATKLELNLAQQMDLIHGLKEVASDLGQYERQRSKTVGIIEV